MSRPRPAYPMESRRPPHSRRSTPNAGTHSNANPKTLRSKLTHFIRTSPGRTRGSILPIHSEHTMKISIRLLIFLTVLCILPLIAQAQFGSLGSTFSNLGSNLSSGFGGQGEDTSSLAVEERDYETERIRLQYKTLFGTYFTNAADSDFNPKREQFFYPYGQTALSNHGNAVYSYVYDGHIKPGLNLHQSPYHLYRTNLEDIRVYAAEKPFGSLGYVFGAREQQLLSGVYTQNISSGLNIFFDYRFSNSPGFFKNQNTNNSQLSGGVHYKNVAGTYLLTAAYIRNNMVSNENGGIVNKDDITGSDVEAFNDRTTVPVMLGDAVGYNTNPFNLTLNKGRKQNSNVLYVANTYSVGARDSVYGPDSLLMRIFKPRLSFTHSLEYSTQENMFLDHSAETDQRFYNTFYPSLPAGLLTQTLLIRDKWNILSNRVSVRYLPNANDLKSFVNARICYDAMRDSMMVNTALPDAPYLFNLSADGNLRIHSKKINAQVGLYGQYYLAGLNRNDFQVSAQLTKRIANTRLFVHADYTRSTPVHFFRRYSAFNVFRMDREQFSPLLSFRVYARWVVPRYKVSLSVGWNRVANYVWQNKFDRAQQLTAAINIPSVEVTKHFDFGRYFHLRTRTTIQPPINLFGFAGDKAYSDVLNLPLLYTFNEVYFQKTFKKTFLVQTGAEIYYHTPFFAPLYSPVYAHFVYQNHSVLGRIPQVHLYAKTRVNRKFSLVLRLENVNAIEFANGTIQTNNNLFTITGYPYAELTYSIGIVWDFVN